MKFKKLTEAPEILNGPRGVFGVRLGDDLIIRAISNNKEVFNENTINDFDNFEKEIKKFGRLSVSIWNKYVADKSLVLSNEWGDEGIWLNAGNADVQILPLKSHKGVVYCN